MKEFPLKDVAVKENEKDRITYVKVSKNRQYEIKKDEGNLENRVNEIKMFQESQFFIGKVK